MLSRYRGFEAVGQGGMGIVYRAHDTMLDRPVALKFLTEGAYAKRQLRARLLREARVAAGLNHPNICTVYEVGEVDETEASSVELRGIDAGVPYIVMEYVEGRPLDRILGGRRKLRIDEVVELAVQIADAVTAAHSQNVIHRDLKPSNVVVTPDGRVKILDFGLAKPIATNERDDVLTAAETVSDELTAAGTVLGTVAYMSPEQATGQSLDHRSDIFSFGALLYEMACGRRAFRGDNPVSTLARILEHDVDPLEEVRVDLPHELSRIVSRCLRKKPEERYNDTRDLVVALKDLRQETTSAGVRRMEPGVVRASAGMRSTRLARLPRWVLPLAVVLVAALAGVIAPLVLRREAAVATRVDGGMTLAVLAFDNLQEEGDPQRFGQVLQELVITDLTDLPAFKVLSSQRLADVRKQLASGGRDADRDATGIRLARHAGATAMLTGSLSRLGEKYILTSQLVDVANGSVTASARIDGDDLYTMADMLTTQLRGDLRLTASGSELLAQDVREKTTSSLEAYRHYLAGEELLNDQQFEESVAEYRKAVEIDPSFGQARYKLAVASWWDDVDGYDEEAMEILSGFLLNDFEAPRRLKRLAEGLLALARGQFDDGLPIFERLVREYPEDKEAWLGLGEARYHYPGGVKRTEALEAFEKALELDPTFKIAYVHIFDIYEKQRRYDESIRVAEEHIRAEPDNEIWYRPWIRSMVLAGRLDQAARALDEALQALDEDPDRKDVLLAAAGAYSSMEHHRKAEELLARARELGPDGEDAATLVAMGQNAMGLGKLRLAEKHFEAALRLEPSSQSAYQGLHEAYMAQDRARDALALVHEAMRKLPDSEKQVQTYWAWLFAAVRAGDDSEVQRAIDRATAAGILERDAARFHMSMAWAYFWIQDSRRAEQYARTALDEVQAGERVEMLNCLGWALLRQDRRDEAKEVFLEALKVAPDHGALLNGLSFLYHAGNDFERAAEYRRRYIESGPWAMVPGVSSLARIYEEWGRVDEAGSLIEDTLEGLTSDDQKRELLVMIARDLISVGELDRAAGVIERAEGLVGDEPDGQLLAVRALLATRHDRFDEAERLMRRALASNLGAHAQWVRRVIRLGMIRLDLQRGDPAAAERTARNMLEAGHVGSSWYRYLAHALCEQRRFAEALEAAEKAYAMSPNYDVSNLLAWILVAGKLDLDRGEDLAQRALELRPERYWIFSGSDPYLPEPEHTLGRIHLERGDRARAVEYLEAVVDKRPDRESLRVDLERARG